MTTMMRPAPAVKKATPFGCGLFDDDIETVPPVGTPPPPPVPDVSGPRGALTLAEWITAVADQLAAHGSPGELCAKALRVVAEDVRYHRAPTPAIYEDRREAWEKEMERLYEDRRRAGFED